MEVLARGFRAAGAGGGAGEPGWSGSWTAATVVATAALLVASWAQAIRLHKAVVLRRQRRRRTGATMAGEDDSNEDRGAPHRARAGGASRKEHLLDLDDALRDAARALSVAAPLAAPLDGWRHAAHDLPSPKPLAATRSTAPANRRFARTKSEDDDLDGGGDWLNRLPVELLLHIFAHLNQEDLAACAHVHPAWRVYIANGHLWHSVRCTLTRDTVNAWSGFLHSGHRRIRVLELVDASDAPAPVFETAEALAHVHRLTIKAKPQQHAPATLTWPRINELLRHSHGLSELHLKALTITDLDLATALRALPEPEKLHTLAIDQCIAGPGSVAERSISPVGPRTISVLRTLPIRALSLEACPRLFDWSIWTLSGALPALQSLHLQLCTRLTDRGLGQIATAFPLLKDLNLHGIASITDEGIATLVARCTALESLNVTSCTLLSDAALTAIASLPRLHSLWCGLCNRLTGSTLRILGAPRPAAPWRVLVLDGLRLYECPDDLTLTHVRTLSLANVATSKLFPSIVRQITVASMPYLETLVVTACEWLNDAGVRAFALTAAGALRTVDLSCNPDIGDLAVSALAASCPNVVSLTLISCHRLTDQGGRRRAERPAMRTVGDRMRSLETLKVSNCSQLTDASLSSIAKLPKLGHLNVYLCKFLSSSALRQLQIRNPRLVIVS